MSRFSVDRLQVDQGVETRELKSCKMSRGIMGLGRPNHLEQPQVQQGEDSGSGIVEFSSVWSRP